MQKVHHCAQINIAAEYRAHCSGAALLLWVSHDGGSTGYQKITCKVSWRLFMLVKMKEFDRNPYTAFKRFHNFDKSVWVSVYTTHTHTHTCRPLVSGPLSAHPWVDQ